MSEQASEAMPLWVVCVLTGISVCCTCALLCLILPRLHRCANRSAPINKVQKRFGPPLRRLFRQAGYQGSVAKLYLAMAFIVVLGWGLGGLLGWPWPVTTGCSVGFALVAPHLYLKLRRQRRQQAFHEQLPSALELMANGLRAGMGVSSAFEVIAHETHDPLGSEFSQLVTEMHLGASLEETLDHLIERNPSSDVRLLTQAILLHKQVGGNLAEVLDTLDHTIRERFWLRREISATTAEQRLSAVVLGLLPLFLALALWTVNREYLLTLVRTQVGHYLLAVTMVLQVLGVLVLRRILKVEI